MVNDTLDRIKNQNPLSEKNVEGLKVINAKTQKFYITHKMHKETNPERPVINSINYHTYQIPRFIDHLQLLVNEISWYIKDNHDFVNKINNFNVPNNSFLVTMVVKALQLHKEIRCQKSSDNFHSTYFDIKQFLF